MYVADFITSSTPNGQKAAGDGFAVARSGMGSTGDVALSLTRSYHPIEIG